MVVATSRVHSRRAGAQLQTATSLQVAPTRESFHTEVMVGLRESSQYDYGLLADLIRKTLMPLVEAFPEVQPLIDCGATIMMPSTEGERLRGHFRAEPLFGLGAQRRPTAYAINLGRVRAILGLVSAGKASVAGGAENEWVSLVADQVAIHRPRDFYTGSFSRLGRNKDYMSKLKIAFRTYGTRIHCLESPAGFTLAEPSGEYAWDLLSSAAHWDWMGTITRLQLGRLFHMKTGRFPQSGIMLPPGYRKVRAEDGHFRVETDPSQRPVVRRLIELADSALDDSTIIRELAKAGLLSRQRRDDSGLLVPIDQVEDAGKALAMLWQHLPTYATGIYSLTVQNSIPGLTRMLELDVYKESPEDLGVFMFDLDFGLPEGGWHEAELIARAIDRRCQPQPKRGKMADERKPLLGLCFGERDGVEYRLLPDDRTYQLRTRPVSPDRPLGSRFRPSEGDLIGRFAAQRLHQTVADLLRKVAASAPIELPLDVDIEEEMQIATELDLEAEKEEQKADNFRRLAGSSADANEGEAFMRLAAETGAHARALRAESSLRREQMSTLRGLTDLQVDARQLLVVAELLERTELMAPPEVCQAVASVIERLDIRTALNEVLASVSITVRLRTNKGTFSVGPVSTTVSNTAGKVGRNRTGSKSRNLHLLRQLFEGPDPDALRKLESLSARGERRRLIGALQSVLPNPRAAGILLDCPIRDLQAVVFSKVLTDAGLSPLQLSAGLDPTWVDEILSVYTSPSWKWTGSTWASSDFSLQRQVVGWMARHAATADGIRSRKLKTVLSLSDLEFHAMLAGDHNKYRGLRAGKLSPLILVKDYPKHARLQPGEERRVRLRACPYCSAIGDAQILRVPELPNGWICRTCRRTPGLNAVFPQAYLDPWVGGARGQNRARTDAQVAENRHVGTQLLAFTVPPLSGIPLGSRSALETWERRRHLHIDGQTITRQELRVWASAHGVTISDQGRVHNHLLRQYLAETRPDAALNPAQGEE